jgi:hypothetical protein
MAESEKKKMGFQFLTERFEIYGVKGLGKIKKRKNGERSAMRRAVVVRSEN